MGKIWLPHFCQIDHMWANDQNTTGNENQDIEMNETDSSGRKIGKIAPRKRKSNLNITQERLHLIKNWSQPGTCFLLLGNIRNENIFKPTEKMVVTDDDLSEIDNLSNSTLFERKVAKITSEIEQKMSNSLSDGDFRSFGRYSGQFFISLDRIEKFKLANWFNLEQSPNQSDENIAVKENMVEFIFGFLEYLGASPEMLQKG